MPFGMKNEDFGQRKSTMSKDLSTRIFNDIQKISIALLEFHTQLLRLSRMVQSSGMIFRDILGTVVTTTTTLMSDLRSETRSLTRAIMLAGVLIMLSIQVIVALGWICLILFITKKREPRSSGPSEQWYPETQRRSRSS